MRNELKIEFNNGGYLYFKTNTNTVKDAEKEFFKSIEKVGITPDNILLYITELVLRDENGNDIDSEIR